jgi:hypothetical protein
MSNQVKLKKGLGGSKVIAMFLFFAFLINLISGVNTAHATDPWYNVSWGYRIKITVNSSQVPSTQTNFPVQVNLADLPVAFFTHVKAAGADIRVTSSDGTTEMPREVVSVDTSSHTGELWFKAPSIANTNYYYIYYGNSGATEPAASATYGSQNVWDTNFKEVYHLNETTVAEGSTLHDSTTNGINLTTLGTATNNSPVATTGQIGGSVNLPSTFQYSGASASSSSNAGISISNRSTVEGWFYLNSIFSSDTNETHLFGTIRGGYPYGVDSIYVTNTGTLVGHLGGDNFTTPASATVSVGAWHHAALTYDQSTIRLYVDGAPSTTLPVGTTLVDSLIKLSTDGGYNSRAGYDEIRMSKIDRSANWIATEYNNQSSTTGFYTASAEEAGAAPTAPGAPTIGTATRGNASASVTFTAPASDGGSAITSYTVTSSPSSITGTGSTSPITVSGLTNGTAYTFTVTATNAIGTGVASAASNSVTPATNPGAPTIGTATAGNTQATVTFSAPVSNGGSTITGYTVTSSPAGGTDSNAGTTGLSHVITGLTNGTAYTFTVTATNSVGTGSASSASNSVTPSTVPGAPTSPVATRNGSGQMSVAFTAPASNGGSAITGYTVTSSPAGGTDSNAGTTGLSHIVTGLTNGTSYTFTVVATNINGNSSASTASSSVTAGAVPDAPTAVTAVKGNTTASVSFTPGSANGYAITGYTVTSSPAGGTDTNAAGTGTTHSITGLTNGTAYTFTVTATNALGTSSASSASSTVTPSTVPGAPTIGTATAGNTSASITFTAPVSTGGATITSYTVNSSPSSITGTGSASPITVSGLTNGTAYTFTVVATNLNGDSSASSASNSVSPANIVPSAPTGVSAAAGDTQGTVTFSAPVSNGGSAITGYTVTSIPAGGTDSNLGSTSLSHIMTGLTNGTSYTFTVVATNSAGNGSASSASNSVTPMTTQPVVVQVSSGGSVSGGRPTPRIIPVPTIPINPIIPPASLPTTTTGVSEANLQPITIPVTVHSSRALIINLQSLLNLFVPNTHLSTDGVFGKLTRVAIKALQKKYDLIPDGVVGPKTREVINTLNINAKRTCAPGVQYNTLTGVKC